MTKNTRVTLIYLGSTVIAFILLNIWYLNERKKDGEKIKNNLGYAIGTLDQCYWGGGARYNALSVLVSFDTKSGRINKIPVDGEPVNYGIAIVGNRYLVVYDTLSPEICNIIFDYPIKDSADFRRYLEEFKTKPLDFEKYF